MNRPSPALVSQHGVRPAPRWALLIFCAAYVLPGVLGRAPWRTADITSVGVMAAMAQGRTSWLSPTLGGVPVDAAPLPHGLGAFAIMLLSPWVEPGTAARLPFVLMLLTTLALTWYATFYLARTEAAQPVAFPFGGEAGHVDYARAVADSSLLALMATLGLLQLGHETTPELAQLASSALFLWGMASAPFRGWRSKTALVAGLSMLAASGAPIMAMVLGLTTAVIARRSSYGNVRALVPLLVAATIIAAVIGTVLDQWHWRRLDAFDPSLLPNTGRMLLWFLWPSWLLVLWALWRWRRQTLHRHIAVPLSIAIVAVVAAMVMNGSQRALLLGLPAFAVLAAFALPTLRRSTGAAIDWFSMFFFTAAAAFIWVVYASLQTGVPAKPASNVAKLYAGFAPSFQWLAFGTAFVATLAWLALVRWRTGRHRAAIWKSLVLPAGGVALVWLLAMTLLLPLADYVRSMTPWTASLARHVPRNSCVAAPGMPLAHVAALELEGGWRVDARPAPLTRATACATALMLTTDSAAFKAPPGWRVIDRVRRPSDRQEVTLVLRRG